MRQLRWIKILLWLLGAISLINGIAMFFAPSTWFFRLVPGVPETGAFNAHLVADSGTFFMAVGAGLLIAGIRSEAPRRGGNRRRDRQPLSFDPAPLFA
jgi:hypothetical protein